MPLTPEQQAEIDEQRSQPNQTLRVVSAGMEAQLYKAHEGAGSRAGAGHRLHGR